MILSLQERRYSVLLSIIAVSFFLGDFFVSNGLFVYFNLVIIITEFIVVAVILIFNTSSLILALFFQEHLSEMEEKWVKQKIKRNSVVVFIWLITTMITILLFAPRLGIIASIYLFVLIFVLNYASVEENPFLERRYEY